MYSLNLKTPFIWVKNKFFSFSFKGRLITSIFVVIFLLAAIKAHQIYQAIQMGKVFAHRPPITVEVVRAIQTDWQPTLNSIGTIEAQNGVDLTPEVAGTVKKILFTAGSDVKKGDVLVQMDTDILSAQLQEAEAKLNLTALSFERTRALLQSQATSASTLDESKANFQASRAQFQQIEAMLEQKTIRAPFDGRVGIRQIQLGQFITPSTVVASIESIDPILVDFSIAEQDIQKIKVGQPVVVNVTAYPDLHFQGNISAIDSKIANDTKSINVQATLSNNDQDHLLVPGMFAAVKITQPPLKDKVVLPNPAIDYTLYGNAVYVVTPQGQDFIVKQVFVKTGDQQNDQVVITSGLQGGEMVVKTGQLKLENDTKVSFKPIE